MKTRMHNISSAMFRNALRVLGTCSLLTMLLCGEVKADRATSAGEFIVSHGTWTQVASACTLDEDTVDYQFGGAGVFFPDSATGEITLRCNITNVMDPDAPWSSLEVVYRDPDGSGTANQVKVTLHKAGLDGIAETLVTTLDPITRRPRSVTDPSLVATFDSNSVTTATSSTQVQKVTLAHDFDFATNAYYVKIKMKRTDASTPGGPATFIIRLYDSFFIGG
jgi:hypothetical protein